MARLVDRATLVITAAAALFGLAAPASATLLDPPIQIGSGLGTTACPIPGGSGTGCHVGTNPMGETNVIGGTLDLYYNSNTASGAIDSPVLLILAVPNDSTTTPLLNSSAVSSATLFTSSDYNSSTGAILAGHTGTTISTIDFGTMSYGLDGNGQEGLMTSSKPKDIYSFLGNISATAASNFDSANNSNNFDNLSTEDSTIGITANNFGIYVFALETSSFDNKDIIDVDLNVPKGTYAVAFGENTGNGGNLFDTPFTEAGWANGDSTGGGGGGGGGDVPEPSSVLVMAIGVLGLGYLMRRRLS